MDVIINLERIREPSVQNSKTSKQIMILTLLQLMKARESIQTMVKR